MTNKIKPFLFTTAMIFLFHAQISAADTVTTETVKTTETVVGQPVPAMGVRTISLADFDLNHDNILSTNEVGEFIFKVYDTDGNNIIDSNEYEHSIALAVMPVEKTTLTTYDFDNDGVPDSTKYTYESFVKDTELARYDQNKNGLSPHEFTGKNFMEMDINKDHAIDLSEWRGSYISSINKKNRRDAETNK